MINTLKEIPLIGLDGSNPLAFLAALGTLRTLSLMHPDAEVRMNWRIDSGSWRPVITLPFADVDERSLCGDMVDWLATPPQMSLLEAEELGDNLTISPQTFRWLSRRYLARAASDEPTALAALEFLAAFGTDAAHQPHSKDHSLMQDTALRTMSGAGHQHFIKFMREIITKTTASHLYATLFQAWSYQDEGRGMNLRWDPIDDRRYAMRWKNPSSDPAATMRGANRLAIEGLPMCPCAPVGNDLRTTGFRFDKGAFWSWPIWQGKLTLLVVQSLLQLSAITDKPREPPSLDLLSLGIATIYTSQRITVGKFRNLTPAKAR